MQAQVQAQVTDNVVKPDDERQAVIRRDSEYAGRGHVGGKGARVGNLTTRRRIRI